MADIIQLLPEHVANQIAAGEVVQRPASVVKELLENSIDAGAGHIKLIVKDAGKTLVQVIDDGKGMSPADARMSIERHATSKIKDAHDLFRIRTKGFRGEALASIVAVSHTEIKTRQEEDDTGTKITVEGSEITSQEAIATPKGTSIAVKNLFFNIPARRNFLKSDKVEMRHIIHEFQRVALAHPEISFSLYHNGNEVFQLPKSNLKQRILGIFGRKTDEKWIPLSEETPIVNIHGFTGKAAYAKKLRGEQFFFVNKRYVKNAYLHHAVKSAYEGLIHENRHPAYIIFLEIDPQRIDINIHPTKTEIKFEDEKEIYSLLLSAVKHSLGQYQVSGSLDFEKDPGLELPYRLARSQKTTPPEIRVDKNFNPFKQSNDSPGWEALYKDNDLPENPETEHVQTETGEILRTESKMNSLFDDDSSIEPSSFKSLTLHNKFIISTIRSGIVVIHRRRAHERVLYEHFLTKLTAGEATPQTLAFPVEIPVSINEKRLIDSLHDDLENCGFVLDILEEKLVFKALPPMLEPEHLPDVIAGLLMSEHENLPQESFSHTDHIAKLMARQSAIRTGQPLSPAESDNLVNELFLCKEPQISPSGKPVFTIIDTQEISNRL